MSELVLRTTATIKEKSLNFEAVKLADGVIATSTLVEKHARPIVMKDNYVGLSLKQKWPTLIM